MWLFVVCVLCRTPLQVTRAMVWISSLHWYWMTSIRLENIALILSLVWRWNLFLSAASYVVHILLMLKMHHFCCTIVIGCRGSGGFRIRLSTQMDFEMSFKDLHWDKVLCQRAVNSRFMEVQPRMPAKWVQFMFLAQWIVKPWITTETQKEQLFDAFLSKLFCILLQISFVIQKNVSTLLSFIKNKSSSNTSTTENCKWGSLNADSNVQACDSIWNVYVDVSLHLNYQTNADKVCTDIIIL